MSNGIESIDLEDELDYELDVDMNPEQEDALLDGDICVSPEPENELVRKMSMTSVSSIQSPETATPKEPLMPFYPTTSDFWSQSLSTFANVLQTNATEKTNNNAIKQEVSLENCKIDLSQIQPPIIDVIPPVQIQQVVDVDEPNLATESFELKDIGSTSPNQSEGLTCTSSSSSSTPTSTSSMKVNAKRNRSKKTRRILKPFNKGFRLSKPGSIPSLTFPRRRFASLISADIPTPTTRSKVPFIIQAQTNGASVSRNVTVNPAFEVLPSTKISSTILNRNRRLNSAVNSLNFTNVVINKRRSIVSLESIVKTSDKVTNKVTTDPTAFAALPMAIDTGEMSDDDKKYLMAIEEQKKKREEVLRQKEWKRDIDGWQFLDD